MFSSAYVHSRGLWRVCSLTEQVEGGSEVQPVVSQLTLAAPFSESFECEYKNKHAYTHAHTHIHIYKIQKHETLMCVATTKVSSE